MDFLAISLFLPRSAVEGHVELLQQRLSFRVGFRGGADYDVHTPNFVNFVEVNFGEYDVFLQAGGIVATTVERLAGYAAEVADTGHSHCDQTIKEFVHTVTAESNLGAERHVFTNAEASDGLLSFRTDSFLTGDCGQVVHSGFGFLA
eukprot:CAMPEP_0182935910 /NCGR_PEP_ID=MMETSP0105_2-20130417/39145_1 /TAXON_ID=81532 ORGANISM="Acanthoeca-like sp., Strain 10tr" /NCGR_SAMPLE_ID=MMETSP0105_2 /ASSEMBLY_ACC=CAM_ASM_000205 /LENGTH=146 /DNA_ID=CAMNT_0025074939 /DNA_START=355 /DNA_END=792 /DNA_ORIENTATION=+